MPRTIRNPHSEIRNRFDVRSYAAQQGISENEAIEKGLKEKSVEFVDKGSEVYAKT